MSLTHPTSHVPWCGQHCCSGKLHLTCISCCHTCRGIGKGLVEKLLSRQNKVIATTRNSQDASQLQQLAAQHSNLTITQLDTSQPQSIKDWAASLKQHTSHVDVLINNAGASIA